MKLLRMSKCVRKERRKETLYNRGTYPLVPAERRLLQRSGCRVTCGHILAVQYNHSLTLHNANHNVSNSEAPTMTLAERSQSTFYLLQSGPGAREYYAKM